VIRIPIGNHLHPSVVVFLAGANYEVIAIRFLVSAIESQCVAGECNLLFG